MFVDGFSFSINNCMFTLDDGGNMYLVPQAGRRCPRLSLQGGGGGGVYVAAACSGCGEVEAEAVCELEAVATVQVKAAGAL